MSYFLVPTKGTCSWRELLDDPEKQWKEGYSAFELANSWESAKGFPKRVKNAFSSSGIPLFDNVEMLYGFPEYQVSLPGGGASSQSDLYVLAKANNELLTIMVEGKVYEPFGEKVATWKGAKPSSGKVTRLRSLLELLNLNEDDVLNKRYQLLHRTASAIIEAKKVNAHHAVMLVHSFSHTSKWYEDYADFVELFKLTPKKNSVVGPVVLDAVSVYFGWVSDYSI